MKSFLIYSLLALALIASVYAADCVHEGHSFHKGETYQPPNSCELLTCIDNNAFSGKGCAEASGPNCETVEGDLTKPYPQCCPTLKCD